MTKRRLNDIDDELSMDLDLPIRKSPKLNPRTNVFEEKLDQEDFTEICQAIKESQLGQIYGWSEDLVQILALFSMGDWYPCWLCSELNSMSHQVRERMDFVNCWFCQNPKIELYAHFCVACDETCTTPEEIGPYCEGCKDCFCYDHAMECKKCGVLFCNKCMKKNNKCDDCQWKNVEKEEFIDLTNVEKEMCIDLTN